MKMIIICFKRIYIIKNSSENTLNISNPGIINIININSAEIFSEFN